MKKILYYSCYSFPLSLIMAAIHTGLLPRNRKISVSDLEQLSLFNEGRKKGRLIFVGLDNRNNKIYALMGSDNKGLLIRFIMSILSLYKIKKESYYFIDCSKYGSIIFTLGWFLYNINFSKFLACYLICFKLRSSYHLLTAGVEEAKVEEVRSSLIFLD
ncbi:DUF3189 family protein [Desulfolucanica intricata]|uniref:DUF3189 family protein n=1 Tax=Desulfolucanica intricata TaxID=1285191 RepID=UPI000833F482|nr:DUF3189 family protein [Desulfolucanica intricata]